MYKLTNVLLFQEIRGCLNARNEVRLIIFITLVL